MPPYRRFISTQAGLSLLSRRATTNLLPTLKELDIGLIPITPLANGFLTGTYKPGEAPPIEAVAQRYGTENNYKVLAALAAWSQDHGHSLLDLAFAWIAAQPQVISIIAGAETAGIPYGALIASRLGKPMIYVRKKPKGHGRMGQIEGYFEEGSSPSVVLTEDLQNFGASKQVFVDALRTAGAKVEHFFVLFDYGTRPEVKADNDKMGLTQHYLCNWYDVLAVAKEKKYFDAETLESVEFYLKNPEGWASAALKRENG